MVCRCVSDASDVMCQSRQDSQCCGGQCSGCQLGSAITRQMDQIASWWETARKNAVAVSIEQHVKVSDVTFLPVTQFGSAG